ncbi:MAG TPA: acyl-CoA dehydrogenase family protein [Dehalococcoidia bacterium]|nr:acyl-CoA dehydrogenase family protein [Dehalococcoidia bacterium]
MDFDLTEEQALLKSNVRTFLEAEIAPQVAQYEAKGPLSREETIQFIKQLMPFGYYNGRLSEEYGGASLDAKTYGLLQEELSRIWPALCGTLWIAGGSQAPHFLTDADQRAFRDRVRAGESIGSGGISEPEHGSDASLMDTNAQLDGDEWIVNGTKTWISNGPICDHIQLSLTVDKSQGRDGIRRLYVDREQSGFETVRHNALLGLRAWPNGELLFDDVRVPRQHLVDPRTVKQTDAGEKKRVWHFDQPRTLLAIMSVGIAQAALDASIKYAQERRQFGRPIGKFQLVQEMIAEMAMETEAARYLTYKAMDLQDKGEDAIWQSSAAKAYATDMAIRVTSKAIEVHGAVGLMEDFPLERYFRDARSLTIPDGTTEIQKLVIARKLLGISAIS